jgi:hypothetical protein
MVLHAPARASGRLISQEQLRSVGLTRAWFAQVRLNPARNHVERAILTGDRLTVLTSAGVVQEFNAETGETMWTAQIGNENYPSLGPAANDQFVALVNGSTLYVLDRTDGRPTIIRQVGGAPGAAPAPMARNAECCTSSPWTAKRTMFRLTCSQDSTERSSAMRLSTSFGSSVGTAMPGTGRPSGPHRRRKISKGSCGGFDSAMDGLTLLKFRKRIP